ncbi:MAG: hypothetical protein D6812_12185 [Deltaproteobacteria bacterium]|nr:MAG: hypothetical protein D6812_12185 [Deltaproteobacteria bacterium]
MPSKSAKQARTMRAAAHDPEFARKLGIPQSVAREFVKADQAKRKRSKAKKTSSKTRSRKTKTRTKRRK